MTLSAVHEAHGVVGDLTSLSVTRLADIPHLFEEACIAVLPTDFKLTSVQSPALLHQAILGGRQRLFQSVHHAPCSSPQVGFQSYVERLLRELGLHPRG